MKRAAHPESFALLAGDPDRPGILANLRDWLGRLPDDKDWRIEIKKYAKERSIRYCRYLNGVAYKKLGDALGYERDDVSEYLCGEHFGWVERPYPDGSFKRTPLRTTTTDENGDRSVLETPEFHAYVKFVRRFGDRHGVYIPEPNEGDY